jgi:hypothetical protein
MFPRVTHPSAADVLLRPLDLHVLSLPPAFALSQDQTLKLDLNFEPADHNVWRGPTIFADCDSHRSRRDLAKSFLNAEIMV